MERIDPLSLISQMNTILETCNKVQKRMRDKETMREVDLERKIQSQDKRIAQLEDKKRSLQRDFERQENTTKELEQKVSELHEKEISLRTSEIKRKNELVVKANAELEAKINEKRRLLEQQRMENTARKSSAQENNEKLSTEVNACNKQLQLHISPMKENHIKFSFKCINPTDPEKTYYFVLYLEESGLYKVTECEPTLPNVESLISNLNSDRDLYSFIKLMRRDFVALDRTHFDAIQ
ncbi:chromosome segregation protein Spc25-domain-containing protein [Mucor mucedo]|uniref:chromosome segregation protein Spc25-domain-containing protein n=1 Tax=Mucor mucedo TaxID=29922 RepID=UPI00221F8792|nr:chromosome segregation protein Spc25-domain-containing protein [Mucor mucedo]KAI7888684.1 chromosome segregation protein Spc25-domain-containing protein [Mucor mucedo]